MPPSASYLDYVKDLFSPFGEITTRRMFGGAGVYCDGMIFAIVDDDTLFLKADDVTRGEFKAANLAPFSFEGKDGVQVSTSYFAPPEEIFDDHDALTHWAGLALGAARRANKSKKKKARKTK